MTTTCFDPVDFPRQDHFFHCLQISNTTVADLHWLGLMGGGIAASVLLSTFRVVARTEHRSSKKGRDENDVTPACAPTCVPLAPTNASNQPTNHIC
jgi:hypothetical protein